jgi:Secretion system C-terminal sorting domain/Kelch motif
MNMRFSRFLSVFAIFICLLSTAVSAQDLNICTQIGQTPEPVSNNAVSAVQLGDTTYLYTFCGIDYSKKWSGIHLKAWRMNTQSGDWVSLPDVPDPEGGKIAAAASVVKGRIYVIGGYHVASDGSEKSSKKVHRFDPLTNAWLADGADIPVAIDDQVQAVWKDSLIFVVTGWSNSGNVPNVQIYNPSTDTWMAGSSTPNNNNYKAFGASGVILGDTLYYCGGASGASGFPASSQFRKGRINPLNPSEISWSTQSNLPAKGYRMAAAIMAGHAVWVGGSDVTYNYDGLAYNGSGGVPALSRIKHYQPHLNALFEDFLDSMNLLSIMDLRGAAQVPQVDAFYTIGGMAPNQMVSDQVIYYAWAYTLDAVSAKATRSVQVFPNPARQRVNIESDAPGNIYLYDLQGRLVMSRQNALELDVSSLEKGVYALFFENASGMARGKVIVD